MAVETYLVIRANVTINDEDHENYENFFGGKKVSDEELAQNILFAYLSPKTDTWQWEVDNEDNYFDGCCNMKGKIKDIEIDGEAEVF